MQQTLLGVMPAELAQAIAAASGATAHASETHTAHGPAAPGAGDGIFATVLEQGAPTAATTESLEPALGANASPDVGATRASVVHAKTHLGVAIPGIAPLRPGVGSTPPAPAAPNIAALEATRLHPDTTPPSLVIPARTRLPRSALVLLGSGLVLLLAAVAFALLWSASKPLSAAVSADEAGKDRLDLVCEGCPDGTLIRLGNASAPVQGQKAYLTPEAPLPLGQTALTFSIERPGEERDEVKVRLPPVEYRIRPDTSTLVGDQPTLTLNVEAIPGSQIEIAAAPVALDASGRGNARIDVAGELRGPSKEVTTFEQAVPYAITPPSGKRYQGELRVKIGVTPLILEAPGGDTITDMERFMLAGRTMKGAQLWVAGNSIPVDDAGRFAQLMSIDSIGETHVTVRASQPGLAPRFLAFRLQRVKNLEREAAKLRQQALPLAQAAKDLQANVGKTVFVSGRIEEVRVDGHRTLVVLQADRDCEGRSCLTRLVYGGLRKLERGLTVLALGRLQQADATPGTRSVPEIEVALLL